jgi:hypothetical protein
MDSQDPVAVAADLNPFCTRLKTSAVRFVW